MHLNSPKTKRHLRSYIAGPKRTDIFSRIFPTTGFDTTEGSKVSFEKELRNMKDYTQHIKSKLPYDMDISTPNKIIKHLGLLDTDSSSRKRVKRSNFDSISQTSDFNNGFNADDRIQRNIRMLKRLQRLQRQRQQRQRQSAPYAIEIVLPILHRRATEPAFEDIEFEV